MQKFNQFITILALVGWSNFSVAQQAGTLDNSFIPASGIESTITTSALQADGKIIIGGCFSKGIERLNTDGSIDNTFSIGTGTDARVSAIAVQSDGKIIIGGYFNSYNGTNTSKIARLNTDGTLDLTFIVGTGVTRTETVTYGDLPGAGIHTIALKEDGKIIIGGFFDSYNGTTIYNLAQLNPDGSLDTTFVSDRIGSRGLVCSIAIQSDNKILVGGGFYSLKCGNYSAFVVRLNTSGIVDSTFKGRVCGALVTTLAIQSNGKIIIGGDYWGYHNDTVQTYADGIVRLNTDGKRDATFLLNQILSTYSIDVNTIVIQNDGKILVGASNPVSSSNDLVNLIFRLDSNGAVDNTFTSGEGVSEARDIYTIAIQNDGKIIIGGNFTSYDVLARNGVARLNGSNPLSINNTEQLGGGKLNIYPIPNNGIFNLDFQQEMRHATIRIIDILGKEIYHSSVDKDVSILNIDISNHNKGIYSIIVNDDGKYYQSKLVVN